MNQTKTSQTKISLSKISLIQISVESFLREVQAIAAENPSYRSGGSGKDGTCDCIGLIIGAIRRAGGKWTGLHGSNYAARKEMISLSPVNSARDLSVGDLVYKALAPGSAGYDLPSRYRPGGSDYSGDLLDYYHVGVVLSVSPLQILHMTTPSPRTDTSLGKWKYHGWLRLLEANSSASSSSTASSVSTASSGFGECSAAPGNEGNSVISDLQRKEVKPMEKVIISGGALRSPINLRESASIHAKLVDEIPQGSEAELLEAGETWSRIRWSGKRGYVKTEFVHRSDASQENPVDPAAAPVPAGSEQTSDPDSDSAPASDPASNDFGEEEFSDSFSEEALDSSKLTPVPRVELERVYEIIGQMLGYCG